MPKFRDLIIVGVGIVAFLIFAFLAKNYVRHYRLGVHNNQEYTIGEITQRRNETRSNHYRYHYFVNNRKYNGRFYFEQRGKYAHLKLGKYFVVYDSLKPKNSVLLPFLPVPDSITSAPPEGWKELPIPVDKEEISKFFRKLLEMNEKMISSDWSSKVGSFIFSNGVQSFQTQGNSEMIDSNYKK